MNKLKLATYLLLIAIQFNSAANAAEQLYTNQPTVTPALANPGKYPVGVTTLSVTNPGQLSAVDFRTIEDRPLTLEVWFPAAVKQTMVTSSYQNVTRSGKAFELQASAYRDAPPTGEASTFPLLVISHGYTGYRTIMFYLAEHLASHGYVVAAIDHTDSTNAEVDFIKSAGAGFASTLLNRARDQQFVLDYLSQQGSALARIINTDSAAVIGYSMGGYGAINTVGGCYDFSASRLQQFGFPADLAESLLPVFNICNAGRKVVDPRWQAFIAFSPWGGEFNIHTAESLAKLKVPGLFVSGDQDDISGFENGVKRLFELSGSKPTYLMVYENARHNIAAHPAPQAAYDNDLDMGHHFEPSWDIETLNRINKHMSLAFLDCQLKDRAAACATLPATEDITQFKLADGKMSPAWPGFKDRWGSGVRFYRK